MVHAEAELITDHTGEEMDWNGMVTLKLLHPTLEGIP